MKALVVLPTYNEATNIAEVLRRLRAAAGDVDVLVVDDSSPDGTGDMAEALSGEMGGIEVLRRPAKSGLGSAYRDGFRVGLARGYDVLVEMDADLSHDPATLPDLLRAVADGGDLAIGTRYMAGGRIPDWPWYRRAISRIGNVYARVLLGISPRDSTSGFRAYRRSALERIDLDTVRADGYGFQVEMAYLVEKGGGRVAEVPIVFRDRALGHSKMSGRIVVEALVLVSWWALRDRLLRRGAPPDELRPSPDGASPDGG